MDNKRKSYTSEFKLKMVLESMQRAASQEEVCKRFGISSSMLHRWKKEFQQHATSIFYETRDPKQKAQSQGYSRNMPILSVSVNQSVWLAPTTSASGPLFSVGTR